MGEERYSVGTLSYTRSGLITLFAWLLWGDFILTLMESVLPTLTPLILKDHGATNEQVALIVVSIGQLVNACLNPIISYKSDRFRSRWGRRRPFILWTTPLVVLFLAMIPFAPQIAKACGSAPGAAFVRAISPVSGVILVFAGLVIGFQIFNMFVSTVYYYLIPDVVPEKLVGRFYGLFRFFGCAAGMLYQYFIFAHAQGHMREIFVGIAVLYGIAIMLMCWRVKEGSYPAPPSAGRTGLVQGVRSYAVECFGQGRFWLVFIGYSSTVWAGCAGVFLLFFYRDEIGLSLEIQGKINALATFAMMLASFPMGMLADRLGGARTLMLGYFFRAIVAIGAFIGIQGLWSAAAWNTASCLAGVLAGAGFGIWIIEEYPRERYGQFCSAGAMFSALGMAVLAPVAAHVLRLLNSYRGLWLCTAFFCFVGLLAVFAAWRMRPTGAAELAHENDSAADAALSIEDSQR